jgi:hypothetical protein
MTFLLNFNLILTMSCSRSSTAPVCPMYDVRLQNTEILIIAFDVLGITLFLMFTVISVILLSDMTHFEEYIRVMT